MLLLINQNIYKYVHDSYSKTQWKYLDPCLGAERATPWALLRVKCVYFQDTLYTVRQHTVDVH